MRKPFNLRLPTLFAIVSATGIAYSAILVYFGLSEIFVILPPVVAIVAGVCFAIILKSVKPSLIIASAALFFLIFAIYFLIKYYEFVQPDVPVNQFVRISGRVSETGFTSSGNRYILIENAAAYGTPLKGKVVAYLTDNGGDYCRRGYEVNFYAVLCKQNFFDGGEVTYRAADAVKYYCPSVSGVEAKYKFSLFGEINYAIERTLYSSLDGETAAVCLAMLTGSTDGISAGTLSSFRNGGIAHVFAVSGLHVGIIYGALSFAFKKVGVNRYVSTVIKLTIITLFVGVCNFSPSSVRALVMCAVASAASCFRRKNDVLNSTSLAAVIILLINPLYLFDVGFVLSFSAVLGIVLLGNRIQRALFFLPKKLSRAISTSLSAQIATVPATLTAFGTVSAAGLFLNVVFIPVISVSYVFIFASTLIGIIIPPIASAVLPAMCLPLELLMNIVVSCGFENALISGNFSNWIFLPFVAVTVGISDKFNLRPFVRAALIVAPFIALTLIYASVNARSHATLTFQGGYDGAAFIVKTQEGSVLVVTEDFNGESVTTGEETDALVVVGDGEDFSVLFNLDYAFNSVYMAGNSVRVPSVAGMTVTYADEFETCGVSFTFTENGVVAEVEGVTVSLVRGGRGDEFSSLISDADFNLICYAGNSAVLYKQNSSYALDKYGSLCYIIEDGKILPSFAAVGE